MVRSKFRAENLAKWTEAIESIFPNGTPDYCVWYRLEHIVCILNSLGKPSLNHTLLPGGGGLDLTGAKTSVEMGCIELDLNGTTHIAKPMRLVFRTTFVEHEWSYFWLETKNLSLTHIEGASVDSIGREYLTELDAVNRPGHYVTPDAWENSYNPEEGVGSELPRNARPVSRYTNGTFLIVAKTSIYNQTTSTYDGRHDRMSEEEFNSYLLTNASAWANKLGLPPPNSFSLKPSSRVEDQQNFYDIPF